jgi:hypothetical protein
LSSYPAGWSTSSFEENAMDDYKKISMMSAVFRAGILLYGLVTLLFVYHYKFSHTVSPETVSSRMLLYYLIIAFAVIDGIVMNVKAYARLKKFNEKGGPVGQLNLGLAIAAGGVFPHFVYALLFKFLGFPNEKTLVFMGLGLIFFVHFMFTAPKFVEAAKTVPVSSE